MLKTVTAQRYYCVYMRLPLRQLQKKNKKGEKRKYKIKGIVFNKNTVKSSVR